MRHKKNFNHLGRKRGHRKAMLANMASSLIVHKRITTTTAKAKALKSYVEPLITKAKEDTTHSRRHVFSLLQDKEATGDLFRDVAVKVGDRPGGYTRIIKLGKRLGDNADMCIIELVDFNENMLAEKAAATKASRRRRGGKKKSDAGVIETLTAGGSVEAEPKPKGAEAKSEVPAVETVVEEKKVEVAEEVVTETTVEAQEVTEEPKAESDDSSSDAEPENQEEKEK